MNHLVPSLSIQTAPDTNAQNGHDPVSRLHQQDGRDPEFRLQDEHDPGHRAGHRNGPDPGSRLGHHNGHDSEVNERSAHEVDTVIRSPTRRQNRQRYF